MAHLQKEGVPSTLVTAMAADHKEAAEDKQIVSHLISPLSITSLSLHHLPLSPSSLSLSITSLSLHHLPLSPSPPSLHHLIATIQVHVTCLVTAAVISSPEPIIQMTSLMHHSSTPRTGMCNPNQCSTLCLQECYKGKVTPSKVDSSPLLHDPHLFHTRKVNHYGYQQ